MINKKLLAKGMSSRWKASERTFEKTLWTSSVSYLEEIFRQRLLAPEGSRVRDESDEVSNDGRDKRGPKRLRF